MRSLVLFVSLILAMPAMAIITSPMSNQFSATGDLSRSDVVDMSVKCDASISAGDLVTLDLTADDGATVTKVDALGEAALCVMVKSCTSGQIKPCRVWGKIEANFDGSYQAAVAGVPVFASAHVGGKVTGITSPSGHNYPVGIALDASSTTGSLEVFVKLL